MEQRIVEVFDRYDKNRDGEIDLDELEQLSADMGIALTDTELRQLFNRIDTDGDGVIKVDQLKEASKLPPVIQFLMSSDAEHENDRRFRRSVFGYVDWKRHRSSQRFLRNLASVGNSNLFRANWQEVLAATSVAALLVLYNDGDFAGLAQQLAAPQGVVDALAAKPVLQLPGLPFTISSAALSLLLVFRTNSAYGRWWEARCIWGSIINTCRDIVRQALARFKPDEAELKEEVTRLVAVYPRCLIFHLGERTDLSVSVLEKKLRKVLPEHQVIALMDATHKPMTVCGLMSQALHRSRVDSMDEMKIDQDISRLTDFYGMCERIFKTPIPVSYSRLTSRFLSVWLLTMPFALYKEVMPHSAIIPVTAVLAFFIFGLEELGYQIEEPFSILPLNSMADGIDASIFEALELDKKRKIVEKPLEIVEEEEPGDEEGDAGPTVALRSANQWAAAAARRAGKARQKGKVKLFKVRWAN